jgi:hypothetical protein
VLRAFSNSSTASTWGDNSRNKDTAPPEIVFDLYVRPLASRNEAA